VPVKPFDSIELRGGGHVALRYGAAQRVTLLSGSTRYTQLHIEDGRKLIIDACNSQCPWHYELQIDIVTPHISGLAISGGGHIEAANGFPPQNKIATAVDGGGNLDIRAIDARDATAAVNGGGKIHLRTDGRLNAAVEGGGSIRYSGNANVTQTVEGGGSVRPDKDD
jgi:hypothetical protein